MGKASGQERAMLGGRDVEVERHAIGKVRSGRTLRTKHWTARTTDGAVASDPWPTKREAMAELRALLAEAVSS